MKELELQGAYAEECEYYLSQICFVGITITDKEDYMVWDSLIKKGQLVVKEIYHRMPMLEKECDHCRWFQDAWK